MLEKLYQGLGACFAQDDPSLIRVEVISEQ